MTTNDELGPVGNAELGQPDAVPTFHGPAFKAELPDIGFGTQRTSGTYIALLLSLEDRNDVPFILNDVLKHFGITAEKLIEFREWDKRGGYTQVGVDGDVPMPKL